VAIRRLLWQLFPSYLAITLVALLGVALYASISFKRVYVQETRQDLEARARLIVGRIRDRPERTDSDACRALARDSGTRITVILPSGRVIGDSEEDSTMMDNHADRPEVMEAIVGKTGSSVRFSHTLQTNMMYVAVAIEEPGKTVAVVRTAMPLKSINEALGGIYWQVALGALVVAVLAAAVSLAVSRRISRPLREMRRGAERFARGDFEHKLVLPGSEEMAALAESMNRMAVQLDDRIRMITEQRNEREAILTSMVEGVLAVDVDERLISLNEAAGEMLGVDPEAVQGKAIREAVGNADLQNFVTRTLSDRGPSEADIVICDDTERFLRAHGALLGDSQGKGIGAVVVLNDATRLRQLENVRRDFVANVSHELKTPITSIKGFVETLRDGAVREPDTAEHFLGIIARQADRLNAIIEDLLLLASVEKDAETDGPTLEQARLEQVLREAVDDCASAASECGIKIEVDCEADLVFRMNPLLIEQAVVNLVDNAIKYSEPGSSVSMKATRRGSEIEISVTDQGLGIESDKLSRLFERFYRVDKARSRKLGGTGLGLAIVKHIAEAHGGSVSVKSTPGEGSVFTVRLPSHG
jgi:two-component system phosphate regulon sensor histidine kinase PhoR